MRQSPTSSPTRALQKQRSPTKSTPQKATIPSTSTTTAATAAASRQDWSVWIVWNPELRKRLAEPPSKSKPALSKTEFVQLCLDTVSKLGRCIPSGDRTVKALCANSDTFTVIKIAHETRDCEDSQGEAGDKVIRTPVEIILSSDETPSIKILNAYGELGELARLLFQVDDIILLKNYTITGDENILINNNVEQSRCQMVYLMNQELDGPTDLRRPFGTERWNSHVNGWVQYFYAMAKMEKGSARCTLLRILPELRQNRRQEIPSSPTQSQQSSKHISTPVASLRSLEARFSRKRHPSGTSKPIQPVNTPTSISPRKSERVEKRHRVELAPVDSQRPDADTIEQIPQNKIVIVGPFSSERLNESEQRAMRRRKESNKGISTRAAADADSDSDNEEFADAVDWDNDATMGHGDGDDGAPIDGDEERNAPSDADGDEEERNAPNDADGDEEERNAPSDENEDEEEFNHFENTRTRRTFTRRNIHNSSRIQVPLEGGFIRDRLNESFSEMNVSTARSPSRSRSPRRPPPDSPASSRSPVSPAPSHNRRDDWHPGERPKLTKANNYAYKKLAELETQLIQEGGERRMIRKEQFVYGVVTSVNLFEKGAFRLRIMDDSGRQDVPVRLCISKNDPKIGPKPHHNDIIRIHRACVQYEGNEMVISATPHRCYTLFDYQDSLIGNIEIASCANSINYTDFDKKRIIELRAFIKQSEQDTAFEDSILIDATSSQDDDGRSDKTDENQEKEKDANSLTSATGSNGVVVVGPVSGQEVEDIDIGSNPNNSGEVCSDLGAVINSEIRTQSQGFGGEINYDITYPVDRAIIYETMNPDGCCLLEQLTNEQPLSSLKFWMLKSSYKSEEDILIARVADGTKSKFHRLVKLFPGDEEEVEIRPCESTGRNNTPEDYVIAPAFDIEIINLSKNHELRASLDSMCTVGRKRYILKQVTIVDHSGPFTRKFRNVKLVVDALNTELLRYDAIDQFSDMEVYNIRFHAKASSSKAKRSTSVERSSLPDTASSEGASEETYYTAVPFTQS